MNENRMSGYALTVPSVLTALPRLLQPAIGWFLYRGNRSRLMATGFMRLTDEEKVQHKPVDLYLT
jgi:hypothetical protein